MSSSLRSGSVSDNNFRLNFDELRWVMEIKKTLEEVLEEEGAEFTVSIFNVPKLLMVCDPDSYIPQQVAVGPYHYWRPELYEMQRYKLAAARRFRKQLQNHKLEDLVHEITKFEPRIRASYHKYLDFNGETLVWMMIMDASFLLEFLQVYEIQEGNKIPAGISSRMSHLVDYAGNKSAHNAILRDIVMLENQIPLCVLTKMMEFKLSSPDDADHALSLILSGLFNELSPFKTGQDNNLNVRISDCAHLLDFFYSKIVPRIEHQQPDHLGINMGEFIESEERKNDEESIRNSSYLKKFLREVWKILSKLNGGPVQLIKKVLLSRPLKVFAKLPWTIVSNLPGVKLIKKHVEYFFNSTKEEENAENEGSASKNLIEKPPLIEEITIPSVTELMNSGVRCVPTNGSISSIKFDSKKRTFHLPKAYLDVNTEVFLRNLVAYEASVASGPLVLARYTELMNGIVDSDEDAKVLRENGVILNHLKSDLEVANLWNGMSKSIKLTKVQELDEVVEEVNKYYNGRLKVKAYKFMRSYIFGSWQFLTFLAAICLLFLMFLQAFCSVYACNRYFRMAISN